MLEPTRWIASATVLVLAMAGAFRPLGAEEAGGPPPLRSYVRKETWSATLLASRAAYQRAAAEDPARPVSAGPWYATEPLAAPSFAAALFPEAKVDLAGAEGRALWTAHPEWADGTVHRLPGSGHSSVSTYLHRRITAAKAARVVASLGSDDGLQVWLNGKVLLVRDVARGAGPDQDLVPLELAAGANELLLKVYNQTGDHGFYCSLGLDGGDPLAALWTAVRGNFSRESAWMERFFDGGHFAWFLASGSVDLEKGGISRAIAAAGPAGRMLEDDLRALAGAGAPADDPRWLDLFAKCCRLGAALDELKAVDLKPLREAIEDLAAAFGDRYAGGHGFLERLAACERDRAGLGEGASGATADAGRQVLDLGERIAALRREALLANPLLDFDRLLLVKRGAGQLGLPQNWQGNCALPRDGYDDEIAILSPVRPDGKVKTFYRPPGGKFVGDVDLDFDGEKMLFSMPGSHGRWQIWEIRADGSGLRQVTRGEEPDVDNYDACYRPDGKIVYDSTAPFQGVPCVGGGNTVANLFIMDADGSGVRQLCFDQDHDWCPAVMNDGRILYTRWEYSDTPHYFSRLLFSMNPDGTGQTALYGSNSYWPNSIFYARAVPDHPSKFVAVISGHHGVPRMGELILFDVAKGTKEAEGVVQRIPGRGRRVDPVIRDALVDDSWPRFLHPYPLSEKYFLVSCQPTPSSSWGIYLVDVFDNMLLLAEAPGYALLEPVPLRRTRRPPVIPDRVNLAAREATVYLSDVYRGEGLRGVPRGTVVSLRVYELHYTYPNMGGHINVGVEGPWDVHRILGTVTVSPDGSALFKVPANTPIGFQPLDAEGKALQVMRSWYTAMPGEAVACVGCHEPLSRTPPLQRAAPSAIQAIVPWYGPSRGFSFKREVQPVLDRFCVGCHDGREGEGAGRPDLRARPQNGWANFTPSYLALQPYVRRPGPESDYHLQAPLEFHADTSGLMQMLRKGHHGVRLDAEGWDRLITWIDLNVPDHGTWGEHQPIPSNFHQRRIEMRTKYADRPEDPEAIPDAKREPAAFVAPAPEPSGPPERPACPGWPFAADEAKRRQEAAGPASHRAVDLGDGVRLDLVLIPAGEFVLGDPRGAQDERPPARAAIAKPFWLGAFEVTNRQYAGFDPLHSSGVQDMHNKDQSVPGFSASEPDQPVVRVSFYEAAAFCRWLSERTGRRFDLPTEAQWEWACRAGTDTALWYGELDADFSKRANLADAALRGMALGSGPQDFPPKDARFDDGAMIECSVGRYEANAWGLRDMHGNVWEWTRTAYRPYPYAEGDGRNDPAAEGGRVVRGGSWCDRPRDARSASRLPYRPYQEVFNVGFRVLCEVDAADAKPEASLIR